MACWYHAARDTIAHDTEDVDGSIPSSRMSFFLRLLHLGSSSTPSTMAVNRLSSLLSLGNTSSDSRSGVKMPSHFACWVGTYTLVGSHIEVIMLP